GMARCSMQQEAARFAALRVFQLDDLGAEPGERLGAGGAGLELAHIENTDAGKKTWPRALGRHVFVPPARSALGIGGNRFGASRILGASVAVRPARLKRRQRRRAKYGDPALGC